MSVSNLNTSVTPPATSGSTLRPNPSYRTQWRKQAQQALAKSKQGGHPDRREHLLIAKFKAWEASQRKQAQQHTQAQQKVAA